MAVGMDVHAVELPVLLGDGLAEARRSPGDRVLVEVAVDGFVGRPLQRGWSGGGGGGRS